MSLRFFADHCVPSSVVNSMRDAGYQVDWLKEHLPTDAPDSLVIAHAQTLASVLLTLNGDFADIINYPPGEYGGIIALQVKNQPASIPATLIRLLTYLADNSASDHYRGKLFLIEPHRIRIRE
ncbi:MAG: DUF5615 family PIN-like protein [Blastocatellia bacterium]|nr:DUF5615 family PIN-like protein [Blastocatellia bacterium]